MERITDKYVFFWGSEFSNWYPAFFNYKGKRFSNSEQAFMWDKAVFFGDFEIGNEILNNGKNPRDAKQLGRQIKNFDVEEWTEVAYSVMVKVNLCKYEQNPLLLKILLSTGDKTIVEASPQDTIWGIGLHWENDDCLDKTKWKGLNLLGKALMEVRERLKK
jgi:ribA/ribD-fused uncharacterized protein